MQSRGVDVRSTSESLSYSKDKEEFIEKLRIAEAESQAMSERAKDRYILKKRKAAAALASRTVGDFRSYIKFVNGRFIEMRKRNIKFGPKLGEYESDGQKNHRTQPIL